MTRNATIAFEPPKRAFASFPLSPQGYTRSRQGTRDGIKWRVVARSSTCGTIVRIRVWIDGVLAAGGDGSEIVVKVTRRGKPWRRLWALASERATDALADALGSGERGAP